MFYWDEEDDEEDEWDEVVQKYDIDLRMLLKSQKSKMKRFVKEGCIEYLGNDTWKVHPIKGYNKNTYTVTFRNGVWDCNCQYRSLKGELCSHIGAVQLWIMRRARGLEDFH